MKSFAATLFLVSTLSAACASEPATVASSLTSVATTASAKPVTPEDVRILALRAEFTNSPNLCDATRLDSQWFGARDSVASYWLESTRGKTKLSGTVHDAVVRIDEQAYTDCENGGPLKGTAKSKERRRLNLAAVQAAWKFLKAEGIDYGSFDRIVLSMPPAVCERGGVFFNTFADDKAFRPILSYHDCTSVYVDAHEVGHSFGLAHANGPTAFDLSADQSSLMGYPADAEGRPRTDVGAWDVVGLDAVSQLRLGNVPAAEILSSGFSGKTVRLESLNGPGKGTKVLRIKSREKLRGDIYVSFRGDESFDANLPESAQNRVAVHQGKTDETTDVDTLIANPSYLLANVGTAKKTETFEHPEFRLTAQKVEAGSATVTIVLKRGAAGP